MAIVVTAAGLDAFEPFAMERMMSKWENAVDFNLSQDDFAKGRDRPKGVGFRLYCNTVQDVDAIAARIKEHGGTLDMEPTDMPWGRIFAVTDPDGFKISIGSEKES